LFYRKQKALKARYWKKGGKIVITKSQDNFYIFQHQAASKKKDRVLTIVLGIVFWAFFTNACFAAQSLCGATTYFPPGTVFTAIVEDGDILSDFKMSLNASVKLKKVPPELEPQFASIKPKENKKLEITEGTSIILSYADVLKATGSMTFARRGSLMLKHNDKYYLLEHEAGQKIAAVLKLGNNGVNVELYPSPEEQGKLKAEFEKNKTGEESVTLLPGTKIWVPVNRPNKFEISLINGEYLYDYVDFFHRAQLEIEEPIRTPPKGLFTAVMRKQAADFKGREFMACVRPANSALGREFFQIKDIEVLDTKSGQARLALSLPQAIRNIDGFEWTSLATPIELRIQSIRNKENSSDVIMAEQRYYMGSQNSAIFVALVATLIVYILPLWFLKLQRRGRSSNGKGLNFGPITIKLNPSASSSKEALLGVTPANFRRPLWFSPLWLGRNRRGNASLSSLQITIWTYLVFGIASYVFILNGQLINITSSILILLGISGSASVASRVTTGRQDERAELITAAKGAGGQSGPLKVLSSPTWPDLISSGGRVDLARLQMLVFTILTAFYVGITAVVTFQFPELPEGLLWLMGISNGVYLGGKVAEPSLANRLAEIELQRRAAESDLSTKKDTAEKAKKRLDEKEQDLKKIKDEITDAKQKKMNTDDLETQQAELEAEVDKFTNDSSEADNKFKQAKAKSEELTEVYQKVVKNLNKAIDKEAGLNT
jgi:hypothetical protein